jgi:renalase
MGSKVVNALTRQPPPRWAIVGAGVAGASCAHRLAQAGAHVTVFEKSRGAGGRMATRRLSWTDAQGQQHEAALDHGVAGFRAESPAFVHVLEGLQSQGVVARWPSRLGHDTHAWHHDVATAQTQWVATPSMPALAEHWLRGIECRMGTPVEWVEKMPSGWSLGDAHGSIGDGFDAVVVTIPLPQAAHLLRPHRPDWAEHAQHVAMVPCWTLMGVTAWPELSAQQQAPTEGRDADLGTVLHAVDSDVIAAIVRNDAKPQRTAQPGRAQWVAHATTAWTQAHLERPNAEVLAIMQQHVQMLLSPAYSTHPHRLAWQHAVVHRWRYAQHQRAVGAARTQGHTPPAPVGPVGPVAWWDASLRLGVCGDGLADRYRQGVEGAWHSAQRLVDAVLADR